MSSVLSTPVLRQALLDTFQGLDPTHAKARDIIEAILDSSPEDDNLVAGLLCALQTHGTSNELLCAAVEVLKDRAVLVPPPCDNLIDCCGTGGDIKNSFNISTAAGIIAASAGAKVSKHGNRSVSSQCGSADVLTEIGICLDHCAEVYERAVNEIGFGFLYARLHHQAMSRLAPVRHALKVPTLFNMAGPLLNPSDAPFQLVGTYSEQNQRLLAGCLQRLGRRKAWVVRADDGMDELSVFCNNHVIEVDQQDIRKFVVKPKKYGLDIHPMRFKEITADKPGRAAQLLWQSLYEAESLPGIIARFNAAAVLYVSGTIEKFPDAVEAAEEAQRDGRSTQTLRSYIEFFK